MFAAQAGPWQGIRSPEILDCPIRQVPGAFKVDLLRRVSPCRYFQTDRVAERSRPDINILLRKRIDVRICSCNQPIPITDHARIVITRDTHHPNLGDGSIARARFPMQAGTVLYFGRSITAQEKLVELSSGSFEAGG